VNLNKNADTSSILNSAQRGGYNEPIQTKTKNAQVVLMYGSPAPSANALDLGEGEPLGAAVHFISSDKLVQRLGYCKQSRPILYSFVTAV
jgi:hypothetical protein